MQFTRATLILLSSMDTNFRVPKSNRWLKLAYKIAIFLNRIPKTTPIFSKLSTTTNNPNKLFYSMKSNSSTTKTNKNRFPLGESRNVPLDYTTKKTLLAENMLFYSLTKILNPIKSKTLIVLVALL